MKRKLLLLNLALLACAGSLGLAHMASMERRSCPRKRHFRATHRGCTGFPRTVCGATRAGDGNQLYWHCRSSSCLPATGNPVVEIDVAPPKPLPPMPVAHGVLDLGSGPTAILSERQGNAATQRGYRAGEYVGELLIVSVTADELVFEWEGEHVRRSLDELRPQEDEPVEVRRSTPPPTKPASRQTVSSAVISASHPLPRPAPVKLKWAGGIYACRPERYFASWNGSGRPSQSCH